MKLNILLIEDNPADAMLVQELLIDSGMHYELTIAQKLSEAIRHCESKSFDIALLDLHLPDSVDLRGYARLASEYPKIAVIVLTGLDDQEVATRAVQLGAQDYLVKGSVTPEILRRVLPYSFERHRAIQSLRAESHEDFLTGVLNRRGLEASIPFLFGRTEIEIALLYFDLDGLKWINDHCGHQTGDQAIVQTAKLLKSCFRSGDIFARIGGDEFVAVLGNVDQIVLEDVLSRIENSVREENERPDRTFNLSFSIGVLKKRIKLEELQENLAIAEKLMYESKYSKGLSRYQCPEPGMRVSLRVSETLANHA